MFYKQHMAKQKKITKIDIISYYMDFVVENNAEPASVAIFSSDHNFEPTVFYNYFSSFNKVEIEIFYLFFYNTLQALDKDESYVNFNARNKVLSFYYTFFENLTANRNFVLILLKNNETPLKSLKKLSKLKKSFENYISDLNIETIDFNQEAIEKIQATTLKSSAWLQLLIILKFWLEDTSQSFEKTDVFIEKYINTSFDLIDTKFLKSVIDLGKFLFKEKKHFKL